MFQRLHAQSDMHRRALVLSAKSSLSIVYATTLIGRAVAQGVDQARNSQGQCCFVEGKGTTNAIYIRRTLAERAIEDLYLCFIDYTKAFDTIKHKNLMNILKTLNIDGRYLRVIKNLYWDQTAAIRYNNKLGEETQKPQKLSKSLQKMLSCL